MPLIYVPKEDQRYLSFNPSPNEGESREEFIERFMRDNKAIQDFPDENQRLALAINYWEEHKQNNLKQPKFIIGDIVTSNDSHFLDYDIVAEVIDVIPDYMVTVKFPSSETPHSYSQKILKPADNMISQHKSKGYINKEKVKKEETNSISKEYLLAFIETAKRFLQYDVYQKIHDKAFHIAGGKRSRIKKAVVPFQDLPLADREKEWDGDQAEQNIREWAGGPDREDIDWERYRQGFLYYDEEDPELFGSYSFPIADVINGELRAVPRAIFTAAGVLEGAMGGTNLSEDVQDKMRSHLERYYDKMAEEFDDDTIIPPWQEVEQSKIIKTDKDKRLVYGVVLEPEVKDAHGDIISAEEIEEAAHFFMINSQTIGKDHKLKAPAEVVQSFIAAVDYIFNDQLIRKGSWILVTKIMNDSLWQDVLAGKYNSYSVGGFALRKKDKDVLSLEEILSA